MVYHSHHLMITRRKIYMLIGCLIYKPTFEVYVCDLLLFELPVAKSKLTTCQFKFSRSVNCVKTPLFSQTV